MTPLKLYLVQIEGPTEIITFEGRADSHTWQFLGTARPACMVLQLQREGEVIAVFTTAVGFSIQDLPE